MLFYCDGEEEKPKEWTVFSAPGAGAIGNLKWSLFGLRACKQIHCDKLTVGSGLFRLWWIDTDSSLYLPMGSVTAFRHNFGDAEREKEIEENLRNMGGGAGVNIPGFQ